MKTWLFPVLALGLSCLSAQAGDIVALCIGNDAYVNPEDQLDTPGKDAELMFATLRNVPGVLPEDIILLKDARRNQMSLALRQFRSRAAGAKLAIIFYSGHGVEDTPTGYDRAETFLLPVDANITNVDDLPDSAIPLRDVLSALEGTRGAARAVILDCCRSGAPAATKALAGSTKIWAVWMKTSNALWVVPFCQMAPSSPSPQALDAKPPPSSRRAIPTAPSPAF